MLEGVHFDCGCRLEGEEGMREQQGRDADHEGCGEEGPAGHVQRGGNLEVHFRKWAQLREAHSEGGICAPKKGPKKENKEKFMIIKSYTITNPWTMMIHLQIAYITNRAMMGSWWLNQLTFIAISKHQ